MHPGDKVFWIDSDFDGVPLDYFQNLPVEGEYYTIKEVRPPELGSGITLEEIPNNVIYNEMQDLFLEPAFHPRRCILSSDSDFPTTI